MVARVCRGAETRLMVGLRRYQTTSAGRKRRESQKRSGYARRTNGVVVVRPSSKKPARPGDSRHLPSHNFVSAIPLLAERPARLAGLVPGRLGLAVDDARLVAFA